MNILHKKLDTADVGIVYIVFTKTAWTFAGTVVQYNYESHQNFVQRTISGKLYKADV